MQELIVRHCHEFPSVLGSLTSLVRLCLLISEGGLEPLPDQTPERTLAEALPRLQRLRHLALGPMPGCMRPRAALSGATQLQSFLWLENEVPSAPDAALPAGPWLAGLQRLSAPASVLANSLTALASAISLVFLGMDAFWLADGNSTPAELVLWAADLPQLQHFVLCSDDDGDTACIVDVLCRRIARLYPAGVFDWGDPDVVTKCLACPLVSPAVKATLLRGLVVTCRFRSPYQFQRFVLQACIATHSYSI